MSRRKPGHPRRPPSRDHIPPGVTELSTVWMNVDPQGLRFEQLIRLVHNGPVTDLRYALGIETDDDLRQLLQVVAAGAAAHAALWASNPAGHPLDDLVFVLGQLGPQ